LDGVTNLVTRLDTATRQVLIEAKLLETAKNPKSIKGIDWSGTLEAQRFSFGNNTFTPGSGVSNNKLVPSTSRLLVDTAKGFNPATAFLDADGVSAVLSFLNKENDSEVIATPRAVTLDNQTATLSVTKAFPVFSVTPGSANSPAGASVTYTNLGAILQVTPRIAADNNIALRVVPEVSNIDGVDHQVLNGSDNTANIYAIRRIDTSVMIPSGHTLVMGGLVNDTKSKSYVKVPVLGDLPLVGLAFRKESKERNKQNLVIFITPTIVETGDYQPTGSGREFMSSRPIETADEKWTSWDSAKPHDWTKPVY
jgi:general secretion pathway protein D